VIERWACATAFAVELSEGVAGLTGTLGFAGAGVVGVGVIGAAGGVDGGVALAGARSGSRGVVGMADSLCAGAVMLLVVNDAAGIGGLSGSRNGTPAPDDNGASPACDGGAYTNEPIDVSAPGEPGSRTLAPGPPICDQISTPTATAANPAPATSTFVPIGAPRNGFPDELDDQPVAREVCDCNAMVCSFLLVTSFGVPVAQACATLTPTPAPPTARARFTTKRAASAIHRVRATHKE